MTTHDPIPACYHAVIAAAEAVPEPRPLHALRVVNAARNWRDPQLQYNPAIAAFCEDVLRSATYDPTADSAQPPAPPQPSRPHKKLQTPILLTATPAVQRESVRIGTLRKEAHDLTRRPNQSLGSDEANLAADIRAAKAELLAVRMLEASGRRVEGYIAYTEKTPEGPDFFWQGASYDVKSIAHDRGCVTLNAKGHDNAEKKPNFYLIVRFLTEDTAHCAIVSSSEVDKWSREEGQKGAPYLWKRWRDLRPVCDLAEFDHLAPPMTFVH